MNGHGAQEHEPRLRYLQDHEIAGHAPDHERSGDADRPYPAEVVYIVPPSLRFDPGGWWTW